MGIIKNINNLPYRPCVGIALFNENGQVFVGERIDTPGAWQMPQGGIDLGENITQAAFRELEEEIGTDKAEILEIMEETLCYDLPEELQGRMWGGNFRGQEQYWIAMRFKGSDDAINLNSHSEPEFSQWKWVELHEIFDLIVPFKRDVYQAVSNAFRKFSKAST